MGEGPLAVVGICFELSCPSIELFLGRPKPECTNLGKWHASLAKCINHSSVSQLVRGVVPVARSRVDRCGSK